MAVLVAARASSIAAAPSGNQALYQRACAACHGQDGRGAPREAVGFDVPLPDFTDCAFASAEPTADWLAVAHDGGPVRAFDRRMPAFGDALSPAELLAILEYVRGFCADDDWPRGELNLPRPLVTKKAFPENEAVITADARAGGVATTLEYERRAGARGQFEVSVPVVVQADPAGRLQRGLGDIALSFTRVLTHSLDAGRIVSVGAELRLPTGKERSGIGSGSTAFEPLVAYGQLLPRDAFVQAQAGAELPVAGGRERPREVFWRAVIGRTIEQGRFGRAWSPMIELLAVREFEPGASTSWDLVPQLHVTLSRRQHVMLNGGVQLPVTRGASRGARLIAALLWDWFDGGLFEGW